MYRYRSTHSESDSDIVHRRGGRRLASFLDDLRSTYAGRRTRDRATASRRDDVPDVATTIELAAEA